MADRHVDALIVGGGIAGAACAEALHEGGFGGSVLIVGREPDPPYERPPASKGYLAGTMDRNACLLHDDAWYPRHNLELATRTSVMKLDTAARTATFSTKEVVEYGVALLATGANVRRLRVDGAQLGGIHYLRALGNADAIRAEAEDAEHVVLIGGSYIACEVAATLTSLGPALHDGHARGRAAHHPLRRGRERLLHRPAPAQGRRARHRRRAGALRGRGRPRAARHHRLGTRGRRRHGRDGHRRGAGRDARALRRPRARRERRRGLRRRPGDLGGRRLGRGRHVRVRLRAARPPRADRALRGGQGAGRGGRGRDARRAPPLPRGAVLLDRPRRLGHRRVGGAERGRRARDRARLARRRRVQRPAPGAAAASSARSRSGAATTSPTRGG